MRNNKPAIVAVICLLVIAAILGVSYYNHTPEGRLKQFFKSANNGDYKAFKSFFAPSVQEALDLKDIEDVESSGKTLAQLYEYRGTQLIEHYAPLEYESVNTTYIDEDNIVIYQKVYKNGKYIGTNNQHMVKLSGTWYLLD